jgi:2-polyprenyl-3-methyl-5-hydroxy-6-metoxy-1,4-benzoquinol methylase
MAERVMGMIKEMHPPIQNDSKTLFEVGSGWGHFLEASRKYFNRVSGVEFSQEQAGYSREHFGLNISEQDIFLNQTSQTYDVIAAWELLEHLPNPNLFLDWAFAHLNPGGQLALSTPNYNRLYRRALGTHWFYFTPSKHLTYFSPQTLKLCFKKPVLGISKSIPPVARFFGSDGIFIIKSILNSHPSNNGSKLYASAKPLN